MTPKRLCKAMYIKRTGSFGILPNDKLFQNGSSLSSTIFDGFIYAGALYGHPGARPVSDAALVGVGRERSDASTRPVRAEGLDRACAPEKNGVQAEGRNG